MKLITTTTGTDLRVLSVAPTAAAVTGGVRPQAGFDGVATRARLAATTAAMGSRPWSPPIT